MTEKRQIEDDELVEITGGGEFEAVVDPTAARPDPGSGGATGPEHDNQAGGDQEFGES